MEGMVSALDDPYSMYFKPAFAEEFARDLAGTFEGIGAEVGIKGDVITVIAPLPDTPASKAGLRAGDKIIAIDDKTTAGMSVEEAVNLIRGKGGTKVTLTIARNGDKEPRKFEIVREKIVVKSVRSEVKKTKSGATIGYIQIRQFNDETSALTKNAVADLLKQSPKGIIIDLRNNPGGYLDAAVDVAGEWMTGPVVYERKYDGTETAVEAKGATPLKDIPTIVLVNQGSASGSEILAGALQDAGQARLVGKKTFGKGSVQDYEELKNGGALKLTVAEWLTPKKRSINKEGIAPDIEVDLTEEDANADKDPQLAKALELLEPAAVAAAAAH
jgi:carboxyl-terminal processing protease